MFFVVLTVAGQIERNCIRRRTSKGRVTSAAKGNHGGHPKIIDDDMLIAKKLTLKTGKNAGKNPSVGQRPGPIQVWVWWR